MKNETCASGPSFLTSVNQQMRTVSGICFFIGSQIQPLDVFLSSNFAKLLESLATGKLMYAQFRFLKLTCLTGFKP